MNVTDTGSVDRTTADRSELAVDTMTVLLAVAEVAMELLVTEVT